MLCVPGTGFFWYIPRRTSYGRERPSTARFEDMEWLLQVNERAHGGPPGTMTTPHCLSRSNGPFTRPGGLTFGGLATFCFFSLGFFSGVGGGDISTADEGVSGSTSSLILLDYCSYDIRNILYAIPSTYFGCVPSMAVDSFLFFVFGVSDFFSKLSVWITNGVSTVVSVCCALHFANADH